MSDKVIKLNFRNKENIQNLGDFLAYIVDKYQFNEALPTDIIHKNELLNADLNYFIEGSILTDRKYEHLTHRYINKYCILFIYEGGVVCNIAEVHVNSDSLRIFPNMLGEDNYKDIKFTEFSDYDSVTDMKLNDLGELIDKTINYCVQKNKYLAKL